MVNSDPQGAVANLQLSSHMLVLFDLLVTLVKVVVEDQVAFRLGKRLETFLQAFSLFTCGFRLDPGHGAFDGQLLAPEILAEDVTGHPMKVARRLAFIGVADVGKSDGDAVEHFVREVFSVTKTFGDEDPD